MNGKDRDDFRDLLRDELKDMKTDIRDSKKDIASIKGKIGKLEAKSSMMGAIAGAVVLFGSELIKKLVGR